LSPFTTIAVIWVGVSACVGAGLYLTHNANCLWAFIIPALIGVTSGGKDTKEEDNQ